MPVFDVGRPRWPSFGYYAASNSGDGRTLMGAWTAAFWNQMELAREREALDAWVAEDEGRDAGHADAAGLLADGVDARQVLRRVGGRAGVVGDQ